ncbi:MAG: thioesterase family protein [Gemmatimonadota bacterium]|nr:MAG: thioesterase family protein [Gemmatimonadota bacterium]
MSGGHGDSGPDGGASLDPELYEEIRRIFADRIPFNHLIGLHLDSFTADRARFRFEMRDDLIGNYIRRSLHGGVISATLDATCGMAALLGSLQRTDRTTDQKLALFGRLGTIDLRVDFLRPGVGRYFEATGWVLRAGKSVAVTRSELRDDEGRLIAVGTGTYTVSTPPAE